MSIATKLAAMSKKVKMGQMQMASKLKQSQLPPKTPKPRKPVKNRLLTKCRFLKALEGTGGLRTLIAKNLGCPVQSVYNILARDEWADMREALQREQDSVADSAEKTVKEMIAQRVDYNVASTTARWLLTRARHKDRQMGDESKVVHEGGDKPIEIKGDNVPVEHLDLPIEVKRQVLEALDRRIALDSREKDKAGPHKA